MVEVIKVFVQFMNHLTIYAVETSSAEAPRGRLSARRLMFLKKDRLWSPWWVASPSREQQSAHGAFRLPGCDGPQDCS